MSSSILHKLLPLVLFGSLTASAARLIFMNSHYAGTPQKLEAACVPQAPYALPYTGIEPVDHGLCQMVALFQAGLNDAPALWHYFMGAIPVGSMLVAVEARRNGGRGVPWYLAYSTIISTLWQLASWGGTLSVYSLLFVCSGSAQRRSGKITQQDALSILIGAGVGAAIHLNFVYFASPHSIIFWQIFPWVMALAQYLSRQFFSSMAMTTASGHDTIIAAYALTFLASAPFHLTLVLPNLSLEKIIEFAPSVAPVSLEHGSLEDIMALMIKWDLAIGNSAILLTSLWFAKSFRQFVCLTIAVVGGTIVVGPAAALSAILIWRELKISRRG